MAKHEDHEGQMEERGEVEEVGFDFDAVEFEFDAIGQEMHDITQMMQKADIVSSWVPTPSGLETYRGIRGLGTHDPIYIIATLRPNSRALYTYSTYTDVHGRSVLPVFSSIEGARAYVDSEARFGVGLDEPVNLQDVDGGLAVVAEILLGTDLTVRDPDPVFHPGRCATAELGKAMKGDAEE
jgi:hypothetical protein